MWVCVCYGVRVMVCVWVFVCLLLSSDEINIDKPVSLELKLGEIEIVEENRNKSQFGDKKKRNLIRRKILGTQFWQFWHFWSDHHHVGFATQKQYQPQGKSLFLICKPF